MSDVAIRVEGLGKQYRIGRRERYRTLRDTLADTASAPVRWVRSLAARTPRVDDHGETDLIWALEDVSFKVPHGAVLGIIGRNGAGKSTLLKILSRITLPTTGRAEIRGRVGSLLEVGTGFHPELTGRENMFLNGAILGMKKVEVSAKFDEIVAFADIEKFIDTPVKHYSSGMYMRLAFAVAAHLEPEIFVVDEVLAVGDAQFQRKCLGKMGDVARQGRTVLFVSHNTAAVRSLCNRVILLDRGRVAADTVDVPLAVASYGGLVATGATWRRDDGIVSAAAPMVFVTLECALRGEQPDCLLEIRGEVRSTRPHAPAFLAFDIVDSTSVPVMQALPNPWPFIPCLQMPQRFHVKIALPPLIPGAYHVNAWLGCHHTQTLDSVSNALTFAISTSPTPGRSFPHTPDHGFVVPASTVSLSLIEGPACAG